MPARCRGAPGALLIYFATLLLPAALVGQTPTVPVYGRVVDEGGQPLAGATVEVGFSYLTAETGADGRFVLHLAPGPKRLIVKRIGYATTQLDIFVRPDVMPPVVVRLRLAPIALSGISVEAPRMPPLGTTVTTQTVRQVPPLGEPDIFRAVVLLPAITQPNDLKGRIHLAGGASDETGVQLDGHPLQDPFHLLGLVGAFNVAALERADVRIHHLAPSLGGRLSGVIDLTSRRPAEEREVEGVLSLLSSGVTVNEPAGPLGIDVLASGRITYLDRIAPLVSSDLPRMGFYEALLRLGRSWGDARVEAIAFRSADRFVDAELDSLPGYEPLRWGESLVGVRLDWRAGGWSLAARGSLDRAFVYLDERNVVVPVQLDENGEPIDPPVYAGNVVDSRRDWASAAVTIAYTTPRWRLEGGLGGDHRRNRQWWIARGLTDEIFSPNMPGLYDGEEEWSALSAFGAASLQPFERWSATVGARVWSAGDVYVAPRAIVEFRPGGGWTIEAAYDRRYQWDAQLEEPVEGSLSPPLFLLEEPRTADVVAGSIRLAAIDLPGALTADFEVQPFWKKYRDRTLLAARPPGVARDTAWPGFPAFDRIRGRSVGVAVGGKIGVAGVALAQASYTYQRVREWIDGRAYPTSWDAPHTLAVFGSVPIGRGWTLNVAYQAHSGRATTPVLARIHAPPADLSHLLGVRYLRGERNSIRVPPYHRVDLGLRRAGTLWGAESTFAIQVLNLFARANPIDYNWSEYYSWLTSSNVHRPSRYGLPILPSIGLELRW